MAQSTTSCFTIDQLILGIVVCHGPIEELELYGLLDKLQQLSKRNGGPQVLTELWVANLQSGPYCPLANKCIADERGNLYELGRGARGQLITATTDGVVTYRAPAGELDRGRETLEGWVDVAGKILRGRPTEEDVRELVLSG